MAGIIGINCNGKQEQATRMLDKITHRGTAGCKIIKDQKATLGAVWPETQTGPTAPRLRQQAAWDGYRPPLPDPAILTQKRGPFALAAITPDGLFLARDPLGISPLYYGRTADGTLCFASEVKALLEVTQQIQEFPPGTWYHDRHGFQTFFKMGPKPALDQAADTVAENLRLRLEQAICRRLDDKVMGSWLSGGLDSSAMVALARPHVRQLHTFAAGLPGAPDLEFARKVADFVKTEHHEIIVQLDDLLDILPEVIYHLESFDALLVRSSLTNYLVAQYAADYVGSVFSGEGADELFGGYAYLKGLAHEQLSGELADITGRLHNTALQRVDRSASAHGLVAHVAFLDINVVEYAMRIPAELKISRRQDNRVEKWILRQALTDVLPSSVLWRRKSKFWQGAGVGDLLARYADENVSDDAFRRERVLKNGWQLNTKEELLYYRIFKEHWGDLDTLAWMGRTKGAPQQEGKR